jgi:hypothetical protein
MAFARSKGGDRRMQGQVNVFRANLLQKLRSLQLFVAHIPHFNFYDKKQRLKLSLNYILNIYIIINLHKMSTKIL